MFLAQQVYAPNSTVRKRISDQRKRYERLIGKPSRGLQVLEKLVLHAAKKAMKNERDNPLNSYPKEEPYKRYEYHRSNKPGECPYTLTHPNREALYKLKALKRDLGIRVVYSLLNPPEDKFIRLTAQDFEAAPDEKGEKPPIERGVQVPDEVLYNLPERGDGISESVDEKEAA